MRLSYETRWLLANQYRVLKSVTTDKDERRFYDEAIAVLENGYELEYSALVPWMDDGLSEPECIEICDILTMHDELSTSWDDLEDKGGIDQRDVRFLGFDGNNEAKALGYAHFLLDVQGRWKELAGSGDGLNSHMPVMEAYRRMLAVWRPIRERRLQSGSWAPGTPLLTADDIKEIVAARVHPASR